MKREHLLIIRFSALGDVAMAVPVVACLAKQYPDLLITVLSRPFARELFEHIAPNVGFMEADLRGEYHGIKGLNTLYRRLVAKKFTAIADFHSVLRSDYLRMRFCVEMYRVAHIDKHRRQRNALVRQQNKELLPCPTSFENYADVLRELGWPVDLTSQEKGFTSMFDINGNVASLSGFPEPLNKKPEGEPWIGVAPFAAHKGKIYPLEKMRQVILVLLQEKPSCRIILFGGGDKETAVFRSWQEEMPQGRVLFAGDVAKGMWQELCLMYHLDVMLSMDSANMHLASLAGTRVVSLWGATHPFAGFMGWQQELGSALQVDLPCRPCSIYGNRPCLRGDYECLNAISPEDVASHILVRLK